MWIWLDVFLIGKRSTSAPSLSIFLKHSFYNDNKLKNYRQCENRNQLCNECLSSFLAMEIRVFMLKCLLLNNFTPLKYIKDNNKNN